MMCSQCGVRRVRRTPGVMGRPRTKCSVCSPASKRKRANEREKAAQREARGRRAEALWMAENAPCGCDRDYLTVPLSSAHLCPRPDVTGSVLGAFFAAFGHAPRYTSIKLTYVDYGLELTA